MLLFNKYEYADVFCNCYSNFITEIDRTLDWCHLKDTLYSIFLGENDLQELPSTLGKSLTELSHLSWINLDHNKVHSIHPGSFPKSLETLSIQYNYLKEFPFHCFEQLSNIKRLYIRGNTLRELPIHGFSTVRILEHLDIGDNNIDYLNGNLFNKTLIVRDLNLDYNKIKRIADETFLGMNVARIYLSMNRIEEISDLAFHGLENSLEYLDLENNNLYSVPKALFILNNLKYLYISSNKIQTIENDSFSGFSSSLKFLSLSSNQLTEVPSEALRVCKRLNHLNIGYNLISEISSDNFSGWGEHLETLLLRNNRIMHLQSNLFKSTPRLRELTLSFNKISEVDPDAFVDIAGSLESLEISFGLYREEFPDDFLKVLKGLLWLALDNNNLKILSSSALSNFVNLQYLNLESNRFTYLPNDLFNASVHANLRDIRLSYNHVNKLETGTFNNLQELQTLVLTGNNIRSIDYRVFYILPNLVSLILSENRINTIYPGAFSNIPNLMRIDLQNNELKGFDFNIFESTMSNFPASLNISRNQIKEILNAKQNLLNIKCFDISHNRLQIIPVKILTLMSRTLKRLQLSYNVITEINPMAFGNLTSLEILTLEHNSIVYLKRRAFSGLTALQILHLSHNHMEQLQIDQFLNLHNLRVLDLSFNHIKSLPRDVFKNTKIERLDLSNNEFVSMPSISLGDIGFTLRHLDISYNNIDHLDSTMFQETQFITELNLCHNKLTILPDNVFSALGNLHLLYMCKNPIRANLKELFHYIPKIRKLNLAAIGMKVAPVFPLPKLVELNLSSNYMHNLSLNSFEGLLSLRTLILSGNKLTSVPMNLWPHLPLLKYLDISMNPIKVRPAMIYFIIYFQFLISEMLHVP